MACVTVVMALLCVVGLAGSVDDVGSELVPLSLGPSSACWAKRTNTDVLNYYCYTDTDRQIYVYNCQLLIVRTGTIR